MSVCLEETVRILEEAAHNVEAQIVLIDLEISMLNNLQWHDFSDRQKIHALFCERISFVSSLGRAIKKFEAYFRPAA